MEFLYSFTLALEKLKDSKLRLISVINGVFWGIFWIILGFILWEPLSKFTKTIIGILPFKFIQHAGAEFIAIIIWLQLILVTIGVFFSLFNNLIKRKYFSIIFSFIIALFWTFIFMFKYESIVNTLNYLIRYFPFDTIEDTVAFVMNIFLLYSFFIASIYSSFQIFSEKTVKKILQEEYPEIEIHKINIFKLAYIIMRDMFIFVIAFSVFYIMLFIPLINLIIIALLWYLLIKNSLNQYVIMMIGESRENKLLIFVNLILNFLPVVNIFAPAISILSCLFYSVESLKERNDSGT